MIAVELAMSRFFRERICFLLYNFSYLGFIVLLQVKWARENYCHSPRQPYSLRLASADIRGSIIVWDVTKGSPQAKFSDSDAPICGMFFELQLNEYYLTVSWHSVGRYGVALATGCHTRHAADSSSRL